MNDTTILLVLLVACFGFFAVFLSARLLPELLRRFVTLSGRSDALQTQIIPSFALTGLLIVLARITIF